MAITNLDALLPTITTESLAALLERKDRPEERLFFEFKREFTADKLAKIVASFANSQGGFLFFGATEVNSRLEALPGIEPGEWAADAWRVIRGNVSPLPAWEPYIVPAPGNPDRVVVVLKVPYSRRTPHILTSTGRIYVRSPGGTSDPIDHIKDRTSLDLLVQRGVANEQAVTERAARFLDDLPARGIGDLSIRKFQYAIASVPLPFGSCEQPGLLTEQGYMNAHKFFQPSRDLHDGQPVEMVEDGVRLDFRGILVTVYRDGTITLFWSVRNELQVSVPVLDGLLEDILTAQRCFIRRVYEAHVFIQFGAGTVHLTESRNSVRWTDAPRVWDWDTEAATGEDGVRRLIEEFRRRLWRAAGRIEFDPE